jgi:Glycine rich protein
VKPYRILPAVGAIGLIGGTLFIASGAASAAATPGATTTPTAPCGKTGIAGASSCTYSVPGTDTFTVPAGVTVATFRVLGAQGGSYPGTAAGGRGGSVTATLSVTPGQVLQVNVGAHGSANTSPGGIANGSGGGSSDVRTGAFGLANRELVAGGGGGGGGSSHATSSARAVTLEVGVSSGNGRVSVSWPIAAVTFIGDSVTAGFGYCGASENAANVSCAPNQAFANAWYFGDNSLSDCRPPAVPNDACSNNNDKGKPWDAPPWSPGPKSPRVAYPYQIAATQSGTSYAAVSDWAMTGATPANWDPRKGVFGPRLKKLKNQYVVMTLGANPLLSDFTNITLAGATIADGPCASSTGYKSGGTWYAGPISAPVDCVNRQWDKIDQTQHLVNVYEGLLRQDDRVLVLGYYQGCPWSFGNWQPAGNVLDGPAKGYSCLSLSRPVSKTDHTLITQWEQAVAVGNSVNTHIHDALLEAQDWAKKQWPGTNRYKDIAWTAPDQAEWALHQPLSTLGSWIFKRDTWIHPDQAGATQLANTVVSAMCSSFGHWCGPQRVWS